MAKNPTWQPDKLLVLYDGYCGMCDATVQWILANDSRDQFQMAPLQGQTASEVLERHDELPSDLDSIIVVQKIDNGEHVLWESSAFFHISAQLDAPWSLLRLGRWCPKVIADWVYRLIARHRLKVFGKLESCSIPDASEINRFLPYLAWRHELDRV